MPTLDRLSMDRRQLMRAAGAGLLGASVSGWLPLLADQLADSAARRRHCILLWMTGGPSQLDTFDMKPGHENGGEFQEASTNVPGLKFSEHLPRLAAQADQLAIVRGLSTKEGDHGRGTFLMRTGHPPQGPIHYPTLGSLVSKQLAETTDDMPAFVSISPYRIFNQAAFGPGFLGPRHAPLTVGASDVYQAAAQPTADGYAELTVDDLAAAPGVGDQQQAERLRLWESLETNFLQRHQAPAPLAHDTVYQRAARLMRSKAAMAFDLSQEQASVRQAYGTGRFGQGCLMARRLIEQGVSFVEVSLGAFGGGALGWDTHRNNFDVVKSLSAELDSGWGMLMQDLRERGLLESTTILWMGEFGRTPKINPGGGRDHYPAAWTCVLAGGGIQGGQAHGRTSDDGMTVAEDQTSVGDVLATLMAGLGVSPETQNISEMGRPIRLAEGKPIATLLR